jgi:predicted ferric reductase
MYRLHKWLGIAALLSALTHWLLAQGPKWLVGLGWLSRPARGPRPVGAPAEGWLGFVQGQRSLAESLGEWAFYAAALLMLLALWRRFPYRLFFKTHRLLALAFVPLAWHSLILLKPAYWSRGLGPALALLMAAALVAALQVLLRRVALERQVVGEVAAITRHPALDVLELEIRFKGQWPGHQAGQFAFVTLHEDEGPHPYTISSAWTGDGRIAFIIKALGDYTASLGGRTRVGDVLRVEGPYGRFNFEGQARRQIWIGAGIGITPFVARMKALAQTPDGRSIDLFHSTAVYDAHAISLLERDAAAAGVRLQVLWDERDGRLDAARLMAAVPQWREADVWFCGPSGFGQALRQGLLAQGLAPERFHQELFEMR